MATAALAPYNRGPRDNRPSEPSEDSQPPPPEVTLGDKISRLLADGQPRARKEAAIEIERRVRAAMVSTGASSAASSAERGQVKSIVECLRKFYVDTPDSFKKKGGLIGLASVAIGLEEGEVAKYLQDLIKPVLDLFHDDDPRVRYYACEALYNIAKVAGEATLEHFRDIFNGLLHLACDVTPEVQKSMQPLDRLMKDIVTEWAPKFNARAFVEQLEGRLDKKNPNLRQLVLGWISLLLKEPAVDMVGYLPHYLEGLFKILGDQSWRDVVHNADALLNELLQGVLSSPEDKALKIMSQTAGIVVKCCSERAPAPETNNNNARMAALCWLHEFVHLQMQKSAAAGRQPDSDETKKWAEMLPDLLRGTLDCIDDPEEEIARMAKDMNDGLLEMVQQLPNDIPIDKLMDKLLPSMQTDKMVVRTACLQWICMLLVQSRERMVRREVLDRLFEPLFQTLLHPDDEVVAAALGVLAQIMGGGQADDGGMQDLFAEVTGELLELFRRERRKLETKGRLMIRCLCGRVAPRRLFIAVARAVQSETADLEFAQQVVQAFSWILFTATETRALREELIATAPPTERSSSPSKKEPPDRPLFFELLEPWFHSPVSALSLCIWAQQYELATELAAHFACFEPTVDLLKELDQLVHLLDSPLFSRVRLQMLEPRRHPALLRCLLGLAMLLPQAGAFATLRDRIRVVQTGLWQEAPRPAAGGQPAAGARAPSPPPEPHKLSWVVGRGAGSPGDSAATTYSIASLLRRFDDITAAVQGQSSH